MVILKLLSEEIFDFSAEQMTQNKIDELKQQMCSEFEEIFKLCSKVLQNAVKQSLVMATLETMLRFLNWMPLSYIFETTIVNVLITRVCALNAVLVSILIHEFQFLESSQFRNVTLKCLAEIVALEVGAEYDPKFRVLFSNVMSSINRMIPPDTDIAEAYETTRDAGKELILNIVLFITNFLTKHASTIETERNNVLVNAHFCMVKISQVEEREIFKICLEYWLKLASELYDENQFTPADESENAMQPRKDLYNEVLANLRIVIVQKMAKPEEVRSLFRSLRQRRARD
jgi:exportin-1